jgi:integrase
MPHPEESDSSQEASRSNESTKTKPSRAQTRPAKGPYYYRRPGRKGLWAYLDRNNKNIPLGTDSEADAPAALARLIESRKVQAVPSGDAKSIAELFEIALTRANTNDADKTAYELGLDLESILGFLQGAKPGPDGKLVERDIQYPIQMSKQVVEDYKSWRLRSPSRRKRNGDGKLVAKNLVSERRINRELTALRRALEIATEKEMGRLTTDQLDEWFERLKEPQVEPHQRGLSTDQLQRFFAHCADWRWTAVFRTFIGSGMRDDELRHLDESDIHDGPKPHISVNPKAPGWCKCHKKGWKTKSWRHRKIPVSQATVQYAREVIRARRLRSSVPDVPAGSVIADARKASGLTIEELAGRSGCSVRMLYHYERRKKLPTDARASAIERALNLSPCSIARQSSRDRFGLGSKSIWSALQRIRKAAQLSHFSLHDLRRAWASHMLAAGHKLELISKWLGHRDVQTTLRYLRVVHDDMPDPASLPF